MVNNHSHSRKHGVLYHKSIRGVRFLAEVNTKIFQRKGRKGFDAKDAKFSDRIDRIDKISRHGIYCQMAITRQLCRHPRLIDYAA